MFFLEACSQWQESSEEQAGLRVRVVVEVRKEGNLVRNNISFYLFICLFICSILYNPEEMLEHQLNLNKSFFFLNAFSSINFLSSQLSPSSAPCLPSPESHALPTLPPAPRWKVGYKPLVNLIPTMNSLRSLLPHSFHADETGFVKFLPCFSKPHTSTNFLINLQNIQSG